MNTGYGYVYFAQQDGGAGPIKIGLSEKPIKRVAQMQHASPVRLVLLACSPGSVDDERGLHYDLRDHRMQGEWFADHPDVTQRMVDFTTNEVVERDDALFAVAMRRAAA